MDIRAEKKYLQSKRLSGDIVWICPFVYTIRSSIFNLRSIFLYNMCIYDVNKFGVYPVGLSNDASS